MDPRRSDPAAHVEATPLWLSHHWPDQHARCVRVAGRAVCRRCIVLYPAAVLAAVALWLLDPPSGVLVAAMWLLPAPMAAEWVLEHCGRVAHHPGRLVALSLLAAPALGAALRLHVEQPFAPTAWAPIAFWALVCGGTAALCSRRGGPGADVGWLQRHEDAEAERLRRLVRQAGVEQRIPSPDSTHDADPSPNGPGGDRWARSTERTAHAAEVASQRSSQPP